MTRRTDLIIAVMLGLLAALARSFFPTEPVGTWGLRVTLLVYAAVFVMRARRPASNESLTRMRSLGTALAYSPLVLCLCYVVGHTVAVLYIFTPGVLVAGALLTTAITWQTVRRLRQGRVTSDTLRLVVATAMFLSGVAYVPLCLWLWSRPDPAVCAAVADHPAVQRLTPDTFPEQRSAPFGLLYMPETQRIAASFKMAGNLSIGLWNNPEANRLVVVDVSDRDNPVLADLALEGDPMPQYMTRGPEDDVLVVTRQGYEEHYLDYVDISAFPNLRLKQRVETVAQPHAVKLTDGDRLMLATMHREILLLDYHTGEVLSGTPIPNWLVTPGLTIINVATSHDRRRAYLAMFGTHIVEVDPSRGEDAIRSKSVGFGCGNLIHDPISTRLYETDFFQNTVRVIDTETLDVVRETPLDFEPRPVTVAPGRDLLAVGAWLDGVVHFLRRSNGDQLDVSVPVGPYLRELAIDDERGLLFAASKCGVYMVDLPTLGL